MHVFQMKRNVYRPSWNTPTLGTAGFALASTMYLVSSSLRFKSIEFETNLQ
jgi:hypothetical protein